MTTPFESLYTLPLLDEKQQGHLTIRWVPDAKLYRNIQMLLKQTPQTTEAELVRLFLTTLKQEPGDIYSPKHLTAFTARFTQQVVLRVKAELQALNRCCDDANTFSQDLFQLSIEEALQPVEFYKNFDLERSENAYWFPSLKSYICRRMEGLLCDKIRTQEGMKTYKRTDLGLAARSTRKRMVEALQFVGFREPLLSQYQLLWQCFQELRSGQPDREDSSSLPGHPSQQLALAADPFQPITDRYNQLRLQLPLASELNPALTGTVVEQQLKQIGNAIRRYVDRPKESLDVSAFFRPEDNSASRLDQLVDTTTLQEGELLTSYEIQQEAKAVKQFLEDLFNGLDTEADRMLILLHGIELVQTQVGIELEKNQSTVGRNYKKLLSHLLAQLGQWAIQQEGIPLDSEILSAMKADLIEQLDAYYFAVIDAYFRLRLKALPSTSQELLRLHYLCKLNLQHIAQTLAFPSAQFEETLSRTTRSLQQGVGVLIEQRIQQPLKPQGPAQTQLATLTETWLTTVPDIISL
ncbi:MAG: hypothetical protein HC851_20365 [Acaryochloris sp. RU_4_1]|nr:hypothetical protein [Acaryochloris sp. RU_4_1]NJR56703.1 hypothetical protein [Acaryochloris sp. CRU_2_0]